MSDEDPRCPHYNCVRVEGIQLERFWVCKACKTINRKLRQRPEAERWLRLRVERFMAGWRHCDD